MLIEYDFVDELRLTVFPIVFGAGRRLFGETSVPKPMRLTETRALGDSVVFLRYETNRYPEGGIGYLSAGSGVTEKGEP